MYVCMMELLAQCFMIFIVIEFTYWCSQVWIALYVALRAPSTFTDYILEHVALICVFIFIQELLDDENTVQQGLLTTNLLLFYYLFLNLDIKICKEEQWIMLVRSCMHMVNGLYLYSIFLIFQTLKVLLH